LSDSETLNRIGPGAERLSTASAPRVPALTGVRLFAALAVFCSHIGAPHSSPAWIVSFFTSGYDGVTIFFVLSGFVLTLNYFDGLRRPRLGNVWNYAVARFARIYPLYALVLVWVMMFSLDHHADISGWWTHALAVQAWDPNLTRAFAFDGPAWSVSVEFFLYACAPLLFVALARVDRPASLAAVGVLASLAMFGIATWFLVSGRAALPWPDHASAHRWLYRTPVSRLGDFTLGIVAARLCVILPRDGRIARAGGYMAIGAAAVIVGLMCWSATTYTVWSFDVIYAIPSAVMFLGLALAPGRRLARLLSLPGIVLLGEASYAFYLVHAPMLDRVGDPWTAATAPDTVLYTFLTLGAIFALAVGLHVLVERPARIYIRNLGSVPSSARNSSQSARADRSALPVGIREGMLK
jgi:peptidoglycan/LPS O-acetylase OafA/YrhL